MGKPARGGPAGARTVIPSRASGGPQSLFPPGHELFLMRPEQDNLQKNCQSKHSRQGEAPATETRAGMLLEDALHVSEAGQMDVTCSRAETRPQERPGFPPQEATWVPFHRHAESQRTGLGASHIKGHMDIPEGTSQVAAPRKGYHAFDPRDTCTHADPHSIPPSLGSGPTRLPLLDQSLTACPKLPRVFTSEPLSNNKADFLNLP